MGVTDQPSYRRFRDIYSERTKRVVAWIGAGLSAELGIPLWSGLRKLLENAAEEKFRSLPSTDRSAQMSKLQAAKGLGDHWLAFERLENLLGETTFTETVRRSLQPKNDLPGGCYDQLWALRLDGVLNLNLDGLATRAFYRTRKDPQAQLVEFQGHECGRYAHVLKGDVPFLVDLHGILPNTLSWVFSRRSIKNLQSSTGYQVLLQSIFATRTVLFMGISADDLASGGLLADLRAAGVDVGSHFWMTERRDAATDVWAEKSGIQVIRYHAPNNDHSELIELLADLRDYLPVDSPDSPVTPVVTPSNWNDIKPEALAREDPETIRQFLNAMAADILKTDSAESRQEYARFCREYDYPIDRANYVAAAPPHNKFFGYEVDRQIGKGLFGRVYHALDPSGKPVAIKVLKDDVRANPKLLSAFRRGVRSMQILSKGNVAGMVPYHQAYEIPPCAIMDYVEGPNLDEAIGSGHLKDWSDKLKVGLSLVGIVRAGHLLPERVLHRDLRPQNVMLRNFYSGDNWEVVVLDFDLSWHKDAAEKSVDLGSAAALAYAAPEQLHPVPGVSTRNALVDSFGIGMTLFHICVGGPPSPGDYKRAEWKSSVRKKLSLQTCPEWISLPARLAGLIVRATRVEQARRCDCSAIERELDRLLSALLKPQDVLAAELWADEIAARSWGLENYEWDHDHLHARRVFANGFSITLRGDESERRLCIEASWSSAGDVDTRNIGKYLRGASEKAVAALKRGDWLDIERQEGDKSIRVEAHISVEALRRGAAAKASRAVGELANVLAL